ncbi:aminoglycoside phosphotransferase [Occultella glacieicola]|uniref:Aminoglycoside phosphotransferase n=1 Tax=Occultella glacieicola TaxID=2518684 RepID=A0ABY2DZ19_9MICO|nr:phosphotransferase [Occultella glacieicola]TDE89925.1 aminoglycoside phosphotransferase [Occultella glacieicola]
MHPAGLSLLWEDGHPPDSLRTRFGFTDLDDVAAWLSDVLRRHWGITVARCERVVISAHNAIAWLDTSAGPLVVKIGAHAPAFERLAAIADVLAGLEAAGVPVAAPLPSRGGERRIVAHADRPLSVVVQPLVDGELLDPTDVTAVRAAGAELARLHLAASALPAGAIAADPCLPEPDPRRRLANGPSAAGRAPRASARLADLLEGLPDLDSAPQLIHSDYRSTNILMAGPRVAVILDFDEMMVDHRVYDVARAVVNLATRFRTWRPTTPATRESFLAGYRTIAPFTEREEGWLEAFTLWFGLGSVPAGDDPDGWAAAVEHGL